MEIIMQVIQTLGFPIACVVGMAFFMYKFITRVQDENKTREDKLMGIISQYGEKMGEITATLDKINNEISEIKEKAIK